MAFFLGIDGGGTKTRCALADETSICAISAAGGSNIVRLGEHAAREAIHTAIRQACVTAQVDLSQIHSVCLGAAGAGRPEVASQLKKLIAELTSAPVVEVVGDSVIALEAAFGSSPGAIAIAGTGSIVYGRNSSGDTVRAGGWGFAISDEGSGQWIGREAISAILKAYDKQEATALLNLIFEFWNLNSIDALVQRANASPPPEFPRLFPIVLRAAAEGDAPALHLLTRAAIELASLAAIVLQRIAPVAPYVPVAMTGSVFRQSSDVRHVFYNQVQSQFPGIVVREELVEPVLGAVSRARKLAGRR